MSTLNDRIALLRSKCFAFAGKMTPCEWAEEVYRLPGGQRFRWNYAPYARRIFESYFDRATIETVLEMYSRGLKSTTVLLLIGYLIDQAPRRILSLWPTNSQAEKWSKDVLVGELFDTTAPLMPLGSASKKRNGNITLLHKGFPGGLIDMFGANAPGDMRRAKGSMLYADEIDAIKRNESDEGDPMAIFWKRGDEFPDTIRVSASYPSVRGFSRIDAKMMETDGNQWPSICVRCGGKPFVMHRSMLRYDKADLTTARLECPRCKALLVDSERYQMAHGQGFNNWTPQREFRGKRGYHANAMLWPHPVDPQKFPGGFLQLLAQQEVDADKSEDPKGARRVLINTVDAECYDPTEDIEKPPEWSLVYNRREAYDVAPLETRVLTAFVDVQQNRLEIEWRAWAEDEQSWGMEHQTIDGNTRELAVWEQLAPVLQKKFMRADGAELQLSLCLIDGGWNHETLHSFFRYLMLKQVKGVTGKVRASKGFGKVGHPVIDRRWLSITKNMRGYHIGTWAAKQLVNERLNLIAEGDEFPPGYMHYNKSYGEDYFRQLCTGIATVTFEVVEGKVQEVRKYLNKDKLKDEGLDLAVGNLAAIRQKNWPWQAIESQLAEEAARLKRPEVKEEPQEVRINRPQNSFVGVSRWRI